MEILEPGKVGLYVTVGSVMVVWGSMIINLNRMCVFQVLLGAGITQQQVGVRLQRIW